MIIKKNILDYNDGNGLFDTAGILRDAIADINGLILQGVVNWKRAASAIEKISAVIVEYEKTEKEKEEAADEELRNSYSVVNAGGEPADDV